MTPSSFLRAGTITAILCAVCLVASARPAQAGVNVWTSHGPEDGDVRGLAIDPLTPTTLYAGTYKGADGWQRGGRVFKSTDGGVTWRAITAGAYGSNSWGGIDAFVIDPLTPTTLYVASDFCGQTGPCEFCVACGASVEKSTDGGDTWTNAGEGFTNALAIDPKNPATLYAGRGSSYYFNHPGLFKSTDGGNTWTLTGLVVAVGALAIDPVTPTTLYAGTQAGVFKSTDGAVNWQSVDFPGLPVFDPVTPATMYALAGGVFKSTDGGDTWSAVSTGLISHPVSAIAIDPVEPLRVYAGTAGGGVFKSADGGGSWRSLNAGLTNLNVTALAIDPIEPLRVYAATAGGGVFAIEQSCGNGRIDAGEQCDDGNLNPFDGCTNLCTICGNGVLTPPEECDDGNRVNADGCEADCTLPRCGNGILDPGEQCEDGNLIDGDGCDSNCTPTACGNGVVTAGEECDDGNPIDGDGCDSNCTVHHAVGTGTPESCTEAAFDAALAGGGLVSFDCGSDAVTITLSGSKTVGSGSRAVHTVDGGGLITLSGGNTVQVFEVYGTVHLKNLTIANGRPGIANIGILTVNNCVFAGNRANPDWEGGGGIFNGEGLTVTNSTFVGNSAARDGGGILNYALGTGWHGALTVINSTFSGNTAQHGGAIGMLGGTMTILNSTISGNSAASIGGIYNEGHGEAVLRNTIVANNSGNCNDNVIDGGHNLQWPGTSCGQTIPSLDTRLDPAGLKDNGGPIQTIALLAGSPAINAGDPDVCASPPVNGIDQRGYARPGDGSVNCSIGAFEYNSSGTPPPTFTPMPNATSTVSRTPSATKTPSPTLTMVPPPTVVPSATRTVTPTFSPLPACTGDCRIDGRVTVDELLIMVNIALGNAEMSECESGDDNDDGLVTVDEILMAVNVALNGCGG